MACSGGRASAAAEDMLSFVLLPLSQILKLRMCCIYSVPTYLACWLRFESSCPQTPWPKHSSKPIHR